MPGGINSVYLNKLSLWLYLIVVNDMGCNRRENNYFITNIKGYCMKNRIIKSVVALAVITAMAIGETITLQEGTDGYTGCEDITLLNSAYANDKYGSKFKNSSYEYVQINKQKC